MSKAKVLFGVFTVSFIIAASVCFALAAGNIYAPLPVDAVINYSGPPIKMRVSSHATKTNILIKKMYLPFLESIEKQSKGKIKIEEYFSGVLHSGKDGFKACVNDITDRTHGYVIWQPKSFHLAHALSLPGAFDNAYVSSIVSEKLYPRYFKNEYENMGVYLAEWHTTAPYPIISKKPIRKLEDFKGLKVRCPGGTVSDVMKLLGAVPVLLSTPEVYTSFQRGVVDAVMLSDVDFVSYRVYEIGKYHTDLALFLVSIPYCYNRKFYDNLPSDLRRFLYNMDRQASQLWAKAFESESTAARETMKENGVEFITLKQSEINRIKTSIQPVWDQYSKEQEALGLPVRALLKDMKALTEKYSSWTPSRLMQDVINNPTPGIIDGF